MQGDGLITNREEDWKLVTPSPRSAGQTGTDSVNVFSVRCAKLWNSQQEERLKNISPHERLQMSESFCGHVFLFSLCVCVHV